jgi:glycosyltransferase involved in cell wall biosynthesis
LVHAHQDSGWDLEVPHIIDIHGITWLTAKDSYDRLPNAIGKWKFYFTKLPSLKRREENAYRKAKCLVCAGERIQERVGHLNRTLLIRNAVDLARYGPSASDAFRVAIVGPFIAGHENMLMLEFLHRILELDGKTEYRVIGEMNMSAKQVFTQFPNVQCTDYVDDYVAELRKCSVLLCPYPSQSGFGSSKNKVIEAAACGLAIVSTPEGVVDFNSAITLVGTTPRQLVEHIAYLKDEDVRRPLGRKLRAEVEANHDFLKESAKLKTLYEELA